jgi:hypothetical protein
MGPLSLSLLHSRCSPYIRDVRGTCPHCSTLLSSWKRRTNKLTLHSWQGFADPLAEPFSGPRPYPADTMFGRTSTRPSTAAGPRPSTSSRRTQSAAGIPRVVTVRSGARGRAGTVGTAGTGATSATGGTYLTSSSSNAAPTTGSSNLAGSSNTASSGADTFEYVADGSPGRASTRRERAESGGSRLGRGEVFRDMRTGELIMLESVGRAIG